MMRYIIILCAPLLFSLFSFSHERKAVIEEGTSYEIEKVIYPEIVKLHPPAVHFAIALPLFALLSEGFYTLKRKSPDDLEFFTLLVASGAVITTSVTGYIAHKSMESLPIKKEALEALHIHETIGLTLAGLFAFMFLIRAVYVIKSVKLLRLLYLLLLIAGVVGLFIQGNLGGKLVYDFGLGVSG